MSRDNYIKCRFCGWKTIKFGKNKSGPSRAFWRLQMHIMDNHFSEDAAADLMESFDHDPADLMENHK